MLEFSFSIRLGRRDLLVVIDCDPSSWHLGPGLGWAVRLGPLRLAVTEEVF